MGLVENAVAFNDFFNIKNEAFAEADRRFPYGPPPDPNKPAHEKDNPPNREDNHNDAFRHAFWSANLTRRYGEDWTKKYLIAHERRAGQPPQREAMDLYNNSLGVKIARENPNDTPDQLADKIEKAIKDSGGYNGQHALVIDPSGNLQWSDLVKRQETEWSVSLQQQEPNKNEQTGHPDDGQEKLPAGYPEDHFW